MYISLHHVYRLCGVNAASCDFSDRKEIDRCPLCGIALNEEGVCVKCGYRK